MPLPWLAIIDGLMGAKDLMTWARGRSPKSEERVAASGRLEARLAGVVVSALKEAFDRDHQRLEIERQRMDEERERVERALRMELLRQTGEREIGRLRVLVAVALAGWLGTFVWAARAVNAGAGARIALGIGWLLLLGAIGAALSAHSYVGRIVATADDRTPADQPTASGAGAIAPWLIVSGLAVIALSVLFA
jgi:hypothetical protein